MRSRRVVIELSPSRLEVAVLKSGRVADTRCHRFDRADWPASWTTTLAEYVQPLRQIVTELSIEHADTTIVYSAPGTVANVISCPTKAGAANADLAARLSLAGVGDAPVPPDAVSTACLLVERPVKGMDEADVPSRHVLAAHDAEARTRAVCQWADAAGLTPSRLLPTESVGIAEVIARLAAHTEPSALAILWVSDHCTVLAAGASGRLLFIRTLTAGLESLVEAFTRPLRSASADAPPRQLDRTAARAALKAIGVPAPDTAIPGCDGLPGSALLPHLQPVLQRLAVEVKQSLRFGIPEAKRDGVRLLLIGPGADVPRLSEVLARQCGVPAHTQPNAGAARAVSVIESVTVSRTLAPLSILPPELRAVARTRTIRMALGAGVACALALVGMEAGNTWMNLNKERGRLVALKDVSAGGTNAAVFENAVKAKAALGVLQARARAAVGQQPAWSAVLTTLGQSPEYLHFVSLELSTDGKSNKAVFRGFVRYSDAPDAPMAVTRYMNELGVLPIIESAKLTATQRNQHDGADAQMFEITASLLGLPGMTTANAAAPTEAP